MSLAGIPVPKLILIFMPFMFFSMLALNIYIRREAKQRRLNRIMDTANKSLEEKTISRLKEEADSQPGFVSRQNAKMNILGIEYKFETLIGVAGLLFLVGCVLAVTIFRSGIILMIYLGVLSAASVFIWLNGLIEKKKKQLTLEFLEKMRDVATFLSIGSSLDNALYEALTQGQISRVMFRELEAVRQDIYIHQKASTAFMKMYDRLQIEDIKTYAETLSVFEQSGGNLLMVMKANDKYATSKIELRNQQEVFIQGQKTSQKVVIGLPLAMIVGMFLLNPSFFGDFYSTLGGQLLAVGCITVLVAGVLLSNRVARIE